MDNEILNQTFFLLFLKAVGKTAALPHLTLYADLYMMLLADLFDDIQTDPESSRYLVPAIVSLEDPSTVCNALPLVTDPQHYPIRLFVQRQGDLCSIFRVLDCIGECIVYDAGEFQPAEMEWDILRDIRSDLYILGAQ